MFESFVRKILPVPGLVLRVIVFLAIGGACFAESPSPVNPLESLATMPYQPLASVDGRLRLAGSLTLQQAASHWCDGFTRIHPKVECAIESSSSDAGWKALLAGQADVALLSRPVSEADRAAWKSGSERRLAVVVVGFNRLVWIVNQANPVLSLAWSADAGVLGTSDEGPAAGASAIATTWGRLNGSPEWKDVAIEVHGMEVGSGTRWHLDRLLTGASPCPLEIHEHATVAAIAEAVAHARGGLGLIGDTGGEWDGVKKVGLVIPAGQSPLTDDVAGSARTPDCRPLFLAVALPKEGEMSGVIREFVSYVLSYSGQLDAAKDGLLPLDRGEIHAQKENLGWSVER